MSSISKAAELHAEGILRGLGFVVESLPRSESTRTADLFVADPSETYLVEVTHRGTKASFAELCDLAARYGSSDCERKPGSEPGRNRLDAVVRDKAEQLRQTPATADFRVLWVAAFHDDWSFLANELVRALYGAAKLSVWTSPTSPPETRACLYWHHATFHRARDLNAVVLANLEGGRLMVNALSPNAAAFRQSSLFDVFGDSARLDPATSVTGRTLEVAPDIDRRDLRARWHDLQVRYGLRATELHEMQYLSVTTASAESVT